MFKSVALVTGGAGFIGSHMVDLLLSEGFEVRALDNLSGGHESNISGQKTIRTLLSKKRYIRFDAR